ncbi:MAG: tyrosine--tRNA ligase, partial [Candidatus Niyogibacteria bacterium]|nr:tyrosine--tRNA ligase [Candidatus Niyogibacteria bacterium]
MLFLKNMAGKTKQPPEELLTRAVDEIISKKNLEKKLNSGRKLRVKFGIDPTSPDIHLGHSVALRKLKAFQSLGHTAVLVIGDFTAVIGDPSGRGESRKLLSRAEVNANMKRYLLQAGKIIDLKKTEVRYNSEWYAKGGSELLCEIASGVSLKQILEREDFKKRMDSDRELNLLEVLYPVLQGYDSVRLKADVEIGGADQKLNLLMGRKMQRRYGNPEQDILMTFLIEGTDGKRKMSKSFGNYISLEDSPE